MLRVAFPSFLAVVLVRWQHNRCRKILAVRTIREGESRVAEAGATGAGRAETRSPEAFEDPVGRERIVPVLGVLVVDEEHHA